jgi:hypothetical protein
MICEPMVGWRRVEVTQQRTAIDYAHLLKTLVDSDYAQAEKLIVIQDNLNTYGATIVLAQATITLPTRNLQI